MLVPIILGDFIDGIVWGGDVLAVSVNAGLNRTKLTVASALYARAGLQVEIDGTPADIISADMVECGNDSILVEGQFPNASTWVLDAPVFLHGTPYATNRRLSLSMNAQERIVPLIYLLEIIRQTDDGEQSAVVDADLRMFFLDNADTDNWLTDDHYDNVINRMDALADFFTDKVRDGNRFGRELPFTAYSHADWGQYSDQKGHIQRIFNVNLSGIERRYSLSVLKDCNC